MKQPLYSFIFPTIVAFAKGYDLTTVLPVEGLTGYLHVDDADLVATYTLWSEGKVLATRTTTVPFRAGRFAGTQPIVETFREEDIPEPPGPVFLEFSLKEASDKAVFVGRILHGWYSIYSKPGKKSFFSDNAVKYGSPPVIEMVARYGKFIDTYPVVHIDRERGFGESLVLINPYTRPIVVDIQTYDKRKLPRTKVPPLSSRWIDLSQFLKEGETAWRGQMQLTAANRIVTFECKHRFGDQTVITDHEHLDPYRADPTHLRAGRKARIVLGDALRSARRSLGA